MLLVILKAPNLICSRHPQELLRTRGHSGRAVETSATIAESLREQRPGPARITETIGETDAVGAI